VSSANLDLVRSLYTDWERGDWSSVKCAHPDIEFVIADGPSPGRWMGVAGMTQVRRDFLNTWEYSGAEAEEYRGLDDERVLVLDRYGWRGKTSGLEIARMRSVGATLFHVRDGKVTRIVSYWDRERALAGLGLPAQTDSP
jgi:ketosteroid isomerase-like protein